jgi:hypothetical protein
VIAVVVPSLMLTLAVGVGLGLTTLKPPGWEGSHWMFHVSSTTLLFPPTEAAELQGSDLTQSDLSSGPPWDDSSPLIACEPPGPIEAGPAITWKSLIHLTVPPLEPGIWAILSG